MAHTVTIGSFTGPFDLLLQLIAQRRMAPHEVSLAQITDDFLATMRAMATLDLEVTTEFLVIAATLAELKAARLLPTDTEPELDELAVHVRDLLYARLLDYGVFVEAASFIGGRLEDQRDHVPRAVALEERYRDVAPRTRLSTTPDTLADVMRTVLAAAAERRRAVDTSHLPPIRLTVEQAGDRLVDGLHRHGGRATFGALTSDYGSRVEVAVAFLAVLDLYRTERIDAEQEEPLAPITLDISPDDEVRVELGDLAVGAGVAS